MELRKIIYDNLKTLLIKLTSNGDQFDAFHENLNTERQDILVDLSDNFDRELNKLTTSESNNLIYSDFNDLLNEIQTFKNRFPDFPNSRIGEIQVITYLINFLDEASDEIQLNEDVEILDLKLIKLEKPIYQKNFAFHDSNDLINSMVLLDFIDPLSIATHFTNNSLPEELILQILPHIGKDDNILEETQYVLAQSSIAEKPNQIWSAICLHVVKSGNLIHTPYIYQEKPIVIDSRIINQNIKYQQFNDSIHILSEYNNQHDILDKYLRMYHLIENFMYKFPLVELEKRYAGEVFSMRDFQRMHDVINDNEAKSLKNLFIQLGNEDYSTGIKFSKFLYDSWQHLVPTEISDVNMINDLLGYLRISNTFNSVDENQFPSFFTKLIYGFRNSLVHNRETEFHLTHESLLNHSRIDNTAQILIEKFIIPSLEEVVYYLIIEKNDLVWFENSFIRLFNEN